MVKLLELLSTWLVLLVLSILLNELENHRHLKRGPIFSCRSLSPSGFFWFSQVFNSVINFQFNVLLKFDFKCDLAFSRKNHFIFLIYSGASGCSRNKYQEQGTKANSKVKPPDNGLTHLSIHWIACLISPNDQLDMTDSIIYSRRLENRFRATYFSKDNMKYIRLILIISPSYRSISILQASYITGIFVSLNVFWSVIGHLWSVKFGPFPTVSKFTNIKPPSRIHTILKIPSKLSNFMESLYTNEVWFS